MRFVVCVIPWLIVLIVLPQIAGMFGSAGVFLTLLCCACAFCSGVLFDAWMHGG